MSDPFCSGHTWRPKRLGPISLLKGYEWQFILTFSFAMYIGKGLSAWVASKFLTLSGRDWLQLMPHGLFAILLLQNGLPEDLLTSSPAATVSAAILLNSVGISLLLPVLQFFLEKIKIRHLEAVEDPLDGGNYLHYWCTTLPQPACNGECLFDVSLRYPVSTRISPVSEFYHITKFSNTFLEWKRNPYACAYLFDLFT